MAGTSVRVGLTRPGYAWRSGLARVLANAAGGSPAPVFPLSGLRGRDAARRIRLSRRVQIMDSPRSATLMLIVGELTPRLVRPAIRIHDQVSHPRATVFVVPSVEGDAGRASGPDQPAGVEPPPSIVRRFFPAATVIWHEHELEEIVHSMDRSLLCGDRASETGVQADRPPLPWRGRGPYGHGGKGMTGGTPYGRPLADRGPERDGLELDRLRLRVGPFFPPFPPGLLLDLELQGDVVQEIAPGPNPFFGEVEGLHGSPFERALHTPIPIAVLELARARSHLRWLSDALYALDLSSLAVRALTLAERLDPRDPTGVAAGLDPLLRRLERSRSLAWATRGVGRVEAGRARETDGPVARAAGLEIDARCDDDTYGTLGFRPITHRDGDAWARWRQRIAEVRQSIDLALRAGEARSGGSGVVEDPRGTIVSGPESATGSALELIPGLVAGLEWGDAVLTIISLDLDLEREARVRPPGENGAHRPATSRENGGVESSLEADGHGGLSSGPGAARYP